MVYALWSASWETKPNYWLVKKINRPLNWSNSNDVPSYAFIFHSRYMQIKLCPSRIPPQTRTTHTKTRLVMFSLRYCELYITYDYDFIICFASIVGAKIERNATIIVAVVVGSKRSNVSVTSRYMYMECWVNQQIDPIWQSWSSKYLIECCAPATPQTPSTVQLFDGFENTNIGHACVQSDRYSRPMLVWPMNEFLRCGVRSRVRL